MDTKPLFSLWGYPVYGFALTVAVGAAVSLAVAARCLKRKGLKKQTVDVLALAAIPLCVLGARLAYCLLRFDFVTNDAGWGFFFRLWEGGYVLYGGVLGGLLACWAAARITGQRTFQLSDAIAPAALVMIAFARFGEGFAQEGFGWETEESALFPFFPVGMYESYYEIWYWPLFLLEAAYALVAAVHLYHTWQGGREGDQTLRFLLIYACGQAVFESMRRDSVLRFGFVRCSQLLSALVVGAVLLIYGLQLAKGKRAARLAPAWAGTLAMMGLVMAMEFALEKKIAFLEWLPTEGCYGVMAAAAVGMYAIVRRVGRLRENV